MKINEEVLKKTAKRCREKNIIIPTFAQMKNPDLIPAKIKARLNGVGLWDIDPINLFRITWKNDVKTGQFGGVNYLELPSSITGVKARVIGLVGKYFPTGAHKVGAAFGCLVPRLVTGEFDPTTQKAVWPSTGNYCRGGAFDSALLGCTAVAILPEGMKYGYGIVDELHSGLSYLMKERGIKSVKELTGIALPKPITGFMELTPKKRISDCNLDLCEHCGNCTRCSYQAISLDENKNPVVDASRCIGCSICTQKCFAGALFMANTPRSFIDDEIFLGRALSTVRSALWKKHSTHMCETAFSPSRQALYAGSISITAGTPPGLSPLRSFAAFLT